MVAAIVDMTQICLAYVTATLIGAETSPRLVRSGVGESLREPRRDIIHADGQNRSVCCSEIGLEGYRRAVAPKAIRDGNRALRADHRIGEAI